MNNIERRAIEGIEFRAAAADSGFIGVISGYAAKFNSNSLDLGGYVERIKPGAFKRSLNENPDVITLWSHNNENPVARTPDTLKLSEDSVGLRFEAHLIDTTTNRDLLANIRAKIVRGVSFGFQAQSVQWDSGDKGEPDIRTLLDVDLFEVSPTIWPAYPETTVAARQHGKFLEKRQASPEVRSLELRGNEPAPTTPSPEIALSAADRERRLRILSLAP